MKLGDKVRDKVTGVTGIVMCRTEWMYGCVRLGVQPQELKDGRPLDLVHLDEPQCELVGQGLVDLPDWRAPNVKAAGPRDNAERTADPSR